MGEIVHALVHVNNACWLLSSNEPHTFIHAAHDPMARPPGDKLTYDIWYTSRRMQQCVKICAPLLDTDTHHTSMVCLWICAGRTLRHVLLNIQYHNSANMLQFGERECATSVVALEGCGARGLRCSGVAVLEGCGARGLRCSGVAVLEGCGARGLRCSRVAVLEGCGARGLRCSRVAVLDGCGARRVAMLYKMVHEMQGCGSKCIKV